MKDPGLGSGKTRDEIAEAYRSEPWWYDVRGFGILTFAYNDSLFSQLKFFGPNFGPQHLEVACGTGTLLDLILKWRRYKGLPDVNIVGVDYADTMLAGARWRFRGRTGMVFEHADAAALPYADASFDTANIANSVHSFPNVDGALRDIFRTLKPGGTLAANVLLYPRTVWPFNRIAQAINDWGMKKGILYKPYDHADIRARILAAGFLIQSDQISGNCCNILAVKP